MSSFHVMITWPVYPLHRPPYRKYSSSHWSLPFALHSCKPRQSGRVTLTHTLLPTSPPWSLTSRHTGTRDLHHQLARLQMSGSELCCRRYIHRHYLNNIAVIHPHYLVPITITCQKYFDILAVSQITPKDSSFGQFLQQCPDDQRERHVLASPEPRGNFPLPGNLCRPRHSSPVQTPALFLFSVRRLSGDGRCGATARWFRKDARFSTHVKSHGCLRWALSCCYNCSFSSSSSLLSTFLRKDGETRSHARDTHHMMTL